MRNYRTCCGFGHRDFAAGMAWRVETAIIDAVQAGCTVFMTGGDGDFDKQFAAAVRRVKKRYPQIVLELIKPRYSHTWTAEYAALYDAVVVPEELTTVHYRAAMAARNRWMVDRADVILAFVDHPYGGAYEALRYAEKHHKWIRNLAAEYKAGLVTDVGLCYTIHSYL